MKWVVVRVEGVFLGVGKFVVVVVDVYKEW